MNTITDRRRFLRTSTAAAATTLAFPHVARAASQKAGNASKYDPYHMS